MAVRSEGSGRAEGNKVRGPRWQVRSEGGGAGANDPKAIGHAWHRANLEEAVAAIRAGKQPAVNGAEGRKAVELILALYQSAQAGGALAGDAPPDVPEKETTVMPAPLRCSCPQYGAAHSKPALGPIRSVATAKVILPKPMLPAQGSCLRCVLGSGKGR